MASTNDSLLGANESSGAARSRSAAFPAARGSAPAATSVGPSAMENYYARLQAEAHQRRLQRQLREAQAMSPGRGGATEGSARRDRESPRGGLDAVERIATLDALPRIPRPPKGLDECLQACLRFEEYYARLVGIKAATIVALKRSTAAAAAVAAQHSQAAGVTPQRQFARLADRKLLHFPRALRSYVAQVGALAEVGRRHPDAMVFALAALLPRSAGLPRQIANFTPEVAHAPWMRRLQDALSYDVFLADVRAGGGGSDRGAEEADPYLVASLAELAVADATHAVLCAAEPDALEPVTAVWVARTASYLACKHPAWCAPGTWAETHRQPAEEGGVEVPSAPIYQATESMDAKRRLTPQEATYGITRTLIFEQCASVLGVLSEGHFRFVFSHLLDLAGKTHGDNLSVVFVAACRYFRWDVSTFDGIAYAKTFLRFVTSQLDQHRDPEGRIMHIATLASVLRWMDCSDAYDKPDLLSLFQVEITAIYTMAVRWANQDALKHAAYVLISEIFARSPSSFNTRSHNFVGKRLLTPLTSQERAKRTLASYVRLLRGPYTPQCTGWLPKPIDRLGMTGACWANWIEDEGRHFASVARRDETREMRVGRISQLWEALYFRSHNEGGLRLDASLVDIVVDLALQSTAQALEYMTKNVLPAMLGMTRMTRKGKDGEEWILVAVTTMRCILDPNSGFQTWAAHSVAAEQDMKIDGIAFEESVQEASTMFTPALKKLAKSVAKQFPLSAGENSVADHLWRLEHEEIPCIPVTSSKDVGIVDEEFNLGSEMLHTAPSSHLCYSECEVIKASIQQFTSTYMSDLEDETFASLYSRDPAKVLKVYNMLKLEIPKHNLSAVLAAHSNGKGKGKGAGRVHKPFAASRHEEKASTTVRLMTEVVFVSAVLDPSVLYDVKENGSSVLGSILFSSESRLQRCASLAVQYLALRNPASLVSMLEALCASSERMLFALPGKLAFSLAHAAFLVNVWIDRLDSGASASSSSALAKSNAPIRGMEAWALACQCNGSETVRVMSYALLKKVARLVGVQKNYAITETGDAIRLEVKRVLPVLSIIHGSAGSQLIDRAFFHAGTDYVRLRGVKLPQMKGDASHVIQPSIYKLMASKHAGSCWPQVSQKTLESADAATGGGFAFAKRELWLNVILEMADVLSGQEAFNPLTDRLWSLLNQATKRVPGMAHMMQFEGLDNTFVATTCFFFALSATSRALAKHNAVGKAISDIGNRMALQQIQRPCTLNAYMAEKEKDVSLHSFRVAGTSPIENDHISEALTKWKSFVTSGRSGSPLSYDSVLSEGGAGALHETRKWVHSKSTTHTMLFEKTGIASEVKESISTFISDKAIFSSLLIEDAGLRSAIFKVFKSTHWSSMVLVLQEMIKWYESTSSPTKLPKVLEMLAFVLTSHNIHLSIQYTEKMLNSVLTAITALEDDIALQMQVETAEDRSPRKTPIKADALRANSNIIWCHAMILCFIARSIKRISNHDEKLWSTRKRKHSLRYLTRIYQEIISSMRGDGEPGSSATPSAADPRQSKDRLLANLMEPIGVALYEIMSVCDLEEISEEIAELEESMSLDESATLTLRMFSAAKQKEFQLGHVITDCIMNKKGDAHFFALYQFVFLGMAEDSGDIGEIDIHTVTQIVHHAPLLVLMCTKQLFSSGAKATHIPAKKMLLVIAAVTQVVYSYTDSNPESQAVLAMLRGLYDSGFSGAERTLETDFLKKVAQASRVLSLEIISQTCFMLRNLTFLKKGGDISWMLQTLSYWARPLDISELNAVELKLRTVDDEMMDSKAALSAVVILSELCLLTVDLAEHQKGPSADFSSMVEVWENLGFSSHKESSNLIEVVTFLIKQSVDGAVAHALLRRILRPFARTSQERMVSVLSLIYFRTFHLQAVEGHAGMHIYQAKPIQKDGMLSISGLAALILADIYEGVGQMSGTDEYAKILLCCIMHVDSGNHFLQRGSRALLSKIVTASSSNPSMPTDPRSVPALAGSLGENYRDVAFAICNATSDERHGKILEWSGTFADDYPKASLKKVVRSLITYLAHEVPGFSGVVFEQALGLALESHDSVVSGKAYEVLACIMGFHDVRANDIRTALGSMETLISVHGKNWLHLQTDQMSLMQIQQNLTSTSMHHCVQICRFIQGHVKCIHDRRTKKASNLVPYFWIALAILRSRIGPLFSSGLALLSQVLSNGGDEYLNNTAKAHREMFWQYAEGWNPAAEGIGPLLLWGILQKNYRQQVQSMQLFVHAASFHQQDIFSASVMSRGDLTGTFVFRITVALLWLHCLLKSRNIQKQALVNRTIESDDFRRHEFSRVNAIFVSEAKGDGNGQGEGTVGSDAAFRGLRELLSFGSGGNFSNEPQRFLTACIRTISSDFEEAQLREFSSILSFFACRCAPPLQTSIFQMIHLLFSSPAMHEGLYELFFPVVRLDGISDPECQKLKFHIVNVIANSKTYRVMAGDADAEAMIAERYDRVVFGAKAEDHITGALSAITQVSARMADAAPLPGADPTAHLSSAPGSFPIPGIGAGSNASNAGMGASFGVSNDDLKTLLSFEPPEDIGRLLEQTRLGTAETAAKAKPSTIKFVKRGGRGKVKGKEKENEKEKEKGKGKGRKQQLERMQPPPVPDTSDSLSGDGEALSLSADEVSDFVDGFLTGSEVDELVGVRGSRAGGVGAMGGRGKAQGRRLPPGPGLGRPIAVRMPPPVAMSDGEGEESLSYSDSDFYSDDGSSSVYSSLSDGEEGDGYGNGTQRDGGGGAGGGWRGEGVGVGGYSDGGYSDSYSYYSSEGEEGEEGDGAKGEDSASDYSSSYSTSTEAGQSYSSAD